MGKSSDAPPTAHLKHAVRIIVHRILPLLFLLCLPSNSSAQAVPDKAVLTLAAIHAVSAGLDYQQTIHNISTGGFERDPLAKPFVHSGPGLMAAGGVVEVSATMYVANWMRHNEHPWIRKVWWVPQGVAILSHFGCYGQFKIVSRRR